MAPYTNIPLSPAELSYLHESLSQNPPIRPDGRSSTSFRPLVAESEILPTANGSARICFADGTEAVVGIKAEVEKTRLQADTVTATGRSYGVGKIESEEKEQEDGRGDEAWLEMAVEIPGMRDDDALPIFLSAMLSEALLADGALKTRLWINNRFHWRLYIDILLLSPPLSYPLPLLSLTTHLALVNTKFPALISQGDEDPLFNDDWAAATDLYPSSSSIRPPITLLQMVVNQNIFLDPSREELAVADAVLAVSIVPDERRKGFKIIAMRTIDPPSRLTAAGVPRDLTVAGGGSVSVSAAEALIRRERDEGGKVWRPPRGGLRRDLLAKMMGMIVDENGVGAEILEALRMVRP